MARLQKHRSSKALPSARKSSRLRDPLRRATLGPRRILRYIFGSRKKRYSWTLFQISTAEPFAITPLSPHSMQINLDLDGDGGISGNTRGSHSPHRGIDGLQVRNSRFVMTPDSTIGSLSFSPRTFPVGYSPGGGRRNVSDMGPASNGFASGDSHRADADSDYGSENGSGNGSGKDLWLLTYKYFSNQNSEAPRKERISIASSASKDAASSDGYRADFDLEADPWLLSYSFLDSINDQDSTLQPKRVHKEPQTIRHRQSLRRKPDNEDMRSQWAQNNDSAGMLPVPQSSTNNELQIPVQNDTIAPSAQYSRRSHAPGPYMPPVSNPLPSKYFPDPKTHLSHQGSGSRYPPHNLRISVPSVKEPLADPEPPAPLPTMQEFEAVPVSDGVGERGVVVDWVNSHEDRFELPGHLNLDDQRPKTAPNGGSVNRMTSQRRYSAYAQRPTIQFTIEPPSPLSPPVNRFPTILRSGPASPHFNAHLNFSFNPLAPSSSLLPPLSSPPSVHQKPTSAHVPSSHPSSTTPQPTTIASSRSPPHDLAAFTFPFETSDSPSLEEKIDEEFVAACGRWSKEDERRVRRSREVRECVRRLRECTEFGGEEGKGGLGWEWGF
ncbi:hypothetical protein JMJ35_006847 [Cladonia borealis]|uniref:Uncharacterized protein n=1 Tax=Cladonia borealis TaxID=184061 RepID=A0AA39QWD8_9LECA|nr:hypothetical protein JMJ35_006847 [Cladonia borealis]